MAQNGISFEFEMESFVSEFKKAAWSAGEKALTQVGIDAQRNVAALVPVDTGLLRNSITYAIAGKVPARKNYRADRGDGAGSYDGTIGDSSELAVYIGSNVEYAAAVEANHKTKAHFLRDGITNHIGEYKESIQKIMEEAPTELALFDGLLKG